MQINFKSPTVYRKGDFFCIIFYWREDITKPFIRFRKTYDLNRIQDIKARKKAAQILAVAIGKALADGYNPITDTIPTNKHAAPKTYSISEALEYGYINKLKRIDPNKNRTLEAYGYHYKHFKKFLEKKQLSNYPANDFTPRYAVEYQNYSLDLGLNPVTINTKTEYLSTIFKIAVTGERINQNPFASIEKLKEKESTLYRIYTDDEIQAIKAELLTKAPALFNIFLFVFYAFMRPNSIVNLKVKDIDFENNLIFVSGTTHKNSKDQYKQLLKAHRKYLEPYTLDMDQERYLFQDPNNPNKPMTRRQASDLWKKYVIDGLGINVKLYSAKHTGSSLFLADNGSNENMKWLQMQMSHSSLETTSIYTNKMKIIKLDEDKVQIREI